MTESSESIRQDPKKPIERVGCRVYLSATQTNLVDTVWTKINLNTSNYDLGINFDTATFKFTAPVTGLYKVWGRVHFENIIANKNYGVNIYVNGASVSHSHVHTGSATSEVSADITDELYLNKDDYVELFAQSNSGGDTVDVEAGTAYTFIGVRLISKEAIRQ